MHVQTHGIHLVYDTLAARRHPVPLSFLCREDFEAPEPKNKEPSDRDDPYF